MPPEPFTILVNSSDGFSDCWDPFFTLFATYWPECRADIVLNTESRSYRFPGLEIKCSTVHPPTRLKRLTWSECLSRTLDQIHTPVILLLFEDYFLRHPVNVALIEEFVDLMCRKPNIKHIGLTHFGSTGPFVPTTDSRLWEISKKSRYRVSTQAGLWQVKTLSSYLRAGENAWMFEILGTRRSRRRDELFLTVNREMYNIGKDLILDYIHTGIQKGKWHPGTVQLFESHGIKMDFAKRGLYKSRPRFMERIVTLSKLCQHPRALITGLWAA